MDPKQDKQAYEREQDEKRRGQRADHRVSRPGKVLAPGVQMNRRVRRVIEKRSRNDRAKEAASKYAKTVEEETEKVRKRIAAGESLDDIRAELQSAKVRR